MPKPIRLESNHRNTEEIARFAEFFHDSALVPACIPERGRSGELPELIRVVDFEQLADRVARRLSLRGASIGVIVYTKVDARSLTRLLSDRLPDSARLDCYTSDVSGDVEDDIDITSPGVTVLCGESAIGLEFDTVFLQDIQRSLPCDNEDKRRRLYMLAARAQNSLFLVNGPNPLNHAQLAALPDATLLKQ